MVLKIERSLEDIYYSLLEVETWEKIGLVLQKMGRLPEISRGGHCG